jgi:hypothetical protein
MLLTYMLHASRAGSMNDRPALTHLFVSLPNRAFFTYSRIILECRYLLGILESGYKSMAESSSPFLFPSTSARASSPYLGPGLGLNSVELMLDDRMRRLAWGQVHSADVELLLTGLLGERTMKWARDPTTNHIADLKPLRLADADIRAGRFAYDPHRASTTLAETHKEKWVYCMVVTSVAQAVYEGRLAVKWKYDLLRIKYREFDGDVKDALARLWLDEQNRIGEKMDFPWGAY